MIFSHNNFKYRSIIIFDSTKYSSGSNQGTVFSSQFYQKPNPRRQTRLLGFLFLGLSFAGLILLTSPILSIELAYQYQQRFGKPTYPTKSDQPPANFGMIINPKEEEEEIQTPPNWTFSVFLPKLGVKTKVVDSIDPQDINKYLTALSDGVVHAKGTALPNEQGSIFIFGHSSDYPLGLTHDNSPFYSLDKFEISDEVILLFGRKEYTYQVTEKKIVEANDLQYLLPSPEKRLILQTCWPPQTNLKRLLVIAAPKDTVASANIL